MAAKPLPGINVVGYLRAELGIGQGTRQTVLAAQEAGIDCCLTEFMSGCGHSTGDQTFALNILNRAPHPATLLCVNPDQFHWVERDLPAEYVEGRYRIGYWAWELPDLPEKWVRGFAALDEVWVPSRFVLDAVSQKAPLPVVCIPHAVGFRVSRDANRAQFGLPRDKYLFLAVYDMQSNQSRKNPEAAIAAFSRAFGEARDAVFVVKLMNSHTCREQFSRLQEAAADVPNVIIRDEVLPRQSM